MAAISVVHLSPSCSYIRRHILFSATASSSLERKIFVDGGGRSELKLSNRHTGRLLLTVKAAAGGKGIATSEGYGEPISLGTMKLPSDINVQRFEILLFQWANSLCQGANLPLPVPLKIDKVDGGVRLGFIEIKDGKTEEYAYIDCLVFPAPDGSGPIFRALRNGPFKDQAPPGEPRIMKSLLAALQKSVELSKVQG